MSAEAVTVANAVWEAFKPVDEAVQVIAAAIAAGDAETAIDAVNGMDATSLRRAVVMWAANDADASVQMCARLGPFFGADPAETSDLAAAVADA